MATLTGGSPSSAAREHSLATAPFTPPIAPADLTFGRNLLNHSTFWSDAEYIYLPQRLEHTAAPARLRPPQSRPPPIGIVPRANMGHTRQLRPDSGLVSPVNALKLVFGCCLFALQHVLPPMHRSGKCSPSSAVRAHSLAIAPLTPATATSCSARSSASVSPALGR